MRLALLRSLGRRGHFDNFTVVSRLFANGFPPFVDDAVHVHAQLRDD